MFLVPTWHHTVITLLTLCPVLYLHPHDCFITSNLYLLIPSPFTRWPNTPALWQPPVRHKGLVARTRDREELRSTRRSLLICTNYTYPRGRRFILPHGSVWFTNCRLAFWNVIFIDLYLMFHLPFLEETNYVYGISLIADLENLSLNELWKKHNQMKYQLNKTIWMHIN